MRRWTQKMLALAALALPLLAGPSAFGGFGPGIDQRPPVDQTPSPTIPEPSAIAIFALGAATVGFAVRKRLRR